MRTWTAANSLQLKRMIRQFNLADATNKDSAKTVDDLHIRKNKVFRYLLEDGVIITEDNDRFWMDIGKAIDFLNRIRYNTIRGTIIIVLSFAVLYGIYLLIRNNL